MHHQEVEHILAGQKFFQRNALLSHRLAHEDGEISVQRYVKRYVKHVALEKKIKTSILVKIDHRRFKSKLAVSKATTLASDRTNVPWTFSYIFFNNVFVERKCIAW